jgi:hypothetical protein
MRKSRKRSGEKKIKSSETNVYRERPQRKTCREIKRERERDIERD